MYICVKMGLLVQALSTRLKSFESPDRQGN